MTSIEAPGGQVTELDYDPFGYLSGITNPAQERIGLTSDETGLLKTITDARGGTSEFFYDAAGRLIRDEDAGDGYSALARTGTDRAFSVTLTTALQRRTTYSVDREASGVTTRETVDPAGLRTTAENGTDGSERTVLPDGTQVVRTTRGDPRFGMQADSRGTQTTTLPSGVVRVVERDRQVVLAPSADPHTPLSLVSQSDVVRINGREYRTTYTAEDRTVRFLTPAHRETVTVLDEIGRVVETHAPGYAPVRITYDGRGRLATITEGTGPEARVTSMTYDGLDRLISLQDPLTRAVGFGYDLADRVTVQTRPDAESIGLGYDANGNVTSVTPPRRPAHGFTYTPVDLEASYTPPVLPDVPAPATAYAYNLDKQPTRITRPDGQTVTVGYDTGGRVATITQPRGTTTFAYDATKGTLTSLTAPGGGTLAYTYDGFLRKSVTWGPGPVAGSVSWTYDTDFRLATEAVNGTGNINFGYDPDSLLTQAGALSLTRHLQTGLVTGTTVGVVTDSRTYTTFGEAQTYQAQVSGSPIYGVTYTRDGLGRITAKTETIDGVTTTTGYRYDVVGRLDQVTTNGVVTDTYTYDANGNRLMSTTFGATETGAYDAQDRLLTYGGATYTYTANGELRTKTGATGTTTYTYDLLGNLMAVQLPDGRLIEYVIDGQNRRIGKKINGVLVQAWLYRNQLKPVAELDGSGQVVARFVYGANPLAPDYIIKGGATYRLLTDHVGSPRLVVDTVTGVVVQRRDYDEWGNVLADTSPGFQPFGFAGGLDDPDTQLVRFGVRDYDPQAGRWTSKDPIRFAGRDMNLYGYVSNDPVNRVDPSGLQPKIEMPSFGCGCPEKTADDYIYQLGIAVSLIENGVILATAGALVIEAGPVGFVTGVFLISLGVTNVALGIEALPEELLPEPLQWLDLGLVPCY